MSQQRTNRSGHGPGACAAEYWRGSEISCMRKMGKHGTRGGLHWGAIRFDIRVWRESRTESAGVGWLGVRGGGQSMLPCTCLRKMMGWPVCHVTFVLRESPERIDGHEEQHVVGLSGRNFQIMSAVLRNPGGTFPPFFFQVVILFFRRVQLAE